MQTHTQHFQLAPGLSISASETFNKVSSFHDDQKQIISDVFTAGLHRPARRVKTHRRIDLLHYAVLTCKERHVGLLDEIVYRRFYPNQAKPTRALERELLRFLQGAINAKTSYFCTHKNMH